jgi:hypothetical protein
LAERVRGLSGLVLAEEDLHQVDAECCARFLRNVVTSLGYPASAEFVTVPCVDADESERPCVHVDVRLPDALQGFAGEIAGLGLTASQCVPGEQIGSNLVR